MLKKVLALLVIGGVAVAAVKMTRIGSYAGTCAAQVSDEVKRSIPTKFELERIRREVAHLDQDISHMIRPVAEYKTQIDWMRKDIDKSQARLEEQRKKLLTMTEDLKSNPVSITYDRAYPADVIRHKLQKDFDSFKRLENHLKTQQKLLDAKESSLKASQDQLAKVITKKREYELRLAQLEAEEETMQVARIGNKLQLDDSRATQIEAALTEVEKRHDDERNFIELKAGTIATDQIPVEQKPLDVDAIRNYLHDGPAAAPRAETATAAK
jgi:chromosome segregation ATPase